MIKPDQIEVGKSYRATEIKGQFINRKYEYYVVGKVPSEDKDKELYAFYNKHKDQLELINITWYSYDKDFMFVECNPGEFVDQYGLKKGCTYKVFQGYDYDNKLTKGSVFEVVKKSKKHDCKYKIKMGDDVFTFEYNHKTSHVFQLIKED